jgi:hypothetical protein
MLELLVHCGCRMVEYVGPMGRALGLTFLRLTAPRMNDITCFCGDGYAHFVLDMCYFALRRFQLDTGMF